ncbi:hypothetical protein PR048_005619 [Dryococelus australis]|uniref:Uncharacterized protein n=1 Tax=Dryococelus australis TaxID=614101 RepID=A0ABQ9I8Q6_9NEOP|nr:hypothetical protein PR048_005619 [Dryococelus australis]
MDVFTKFVKLYLMKRATAQVVTEKVLDCYVLDDKWKTLTSMLGIELGFTAVYHPVANLVESVMHKLWWLFRMYYNDHHSHWAVIVNDVETLINSCWHEDTGATPMELLCMGKPHTVLQNILNFPLNNA